MQAVEFQPKNGAVIDDSINTAEKLKDVIDRIVYGNYKEIGFELSQPRLAEILKRIVDFTQGTLIISNNTSNTEKIPAYTILGNDTNFSNYVKSLTVSQLIEILSEFQASGVNHMKGLVPDPGSSAGSTRFLREDATWAIPPGGGGGTYPIVELEASNTILRYEIKTGTPVVSINRVSGIQTISATGGTIKILSLTIIGQSSDLAGDFSFKVVCNGVIGTTLLAYPLIQKWNLSGNIPSDAVPHTADNDNTPQVQITAGTANSSITARIVNLNAFTNWAIKMIW